MNDYTTIFSRGKEDEFLLDTSPSFRAVNLIQSSLCFVSMLTTEPLETALYLRAETMWISFLKKIPDHEKSKLKQSVAQLLVQINAYHMCLHIISVKKGQKEPEAERSLTT